MLFGLAVALWGVAFTILIGPFSLIVSIPGLLIAYAAPKSTNSLSSSALKHLKGRFIVEVLGFIGFSIVAYAAIHMIDNMVPLRLSVNILTPVWVIPAAFTLLSLVRAIRTGLSIEKQL